MQNGMTKNKFYLIIGLIGLTVAGLVSFGSKETSIDDKILSFTVDSKSQDIQFYWKDDSAKALKKYSQFKDLA